MTTKTVTNIHESGYSKLVDLAYFGHKEIVEYKNTNNFQPMVNSGANYGNITMKHLQGLVWRVSEMKQLNIAVFIEENTSSDLIAGCYNEALI